MSKLTIVQIEKILATITDENHDLLVEFKKDSRKGVQQMVNRWFAKKDEELRAEKLFLEMSEYEKSLRQNGISYIAGVDEVGRGPLAGPLIAAAVILPQGIFLPGLNDSKKLTENKREELFEQLQEKALSIGIGIIDAKLIDELNIYQATKVAMTQAIKKLSITPDHILVDAMEVPVNIPQTSIIKGDSKSISIAAASIIAKVTRDRLMKRMGEQYPQYGFEKHMGYGTQFHLHALKEYGVTEEHRKSFSPICDMVTLPKG